MEGDGGSEEMNDKLACIGEALDELSWFWMNDTHPQLAQAIETAVGRGVTPIEVRRYVVQQTQRDELALRCEQAARFLIGR